MTTKKIENCQDELFWLKLGLHVPFTDPCRIQLLEASDVKALQIAKQVFFLIQFDEHNSQGETDSISIHDGPPSFASQPEGVNNTKDESLTLPHFSLKLNFLLIIQATQLSNLSGAC